MNRIGAPGNLRPPERPVGTEPIGREGRHGFESMIVGLSAEGECFDREPEGGMSSGEPTVIVDPFPGTEKVVISDFEYVEALVVRRDAVAPAPGVQWVVDRDFTVEFSVNGEKTRLLVPKGTRTDFSSAPRPFRWLVSRIGPHAEASVVHDYLYEAWKHHRAEPRSMDRLFADKVFNAGMKAAKYACWRRVIAYGFVRCLGWWVFNT